MPRKELTDEQFALIEPLLPPERPKKAGRPYLSHRLVLEGILWIQRTGAPWRDLPERYGKWSTAHERFRRWRREGLFQKILDALEAKGRRAERIDFEFSAVDGSTVRAHKSAAGARKKGPRPKKAAKNRPHTNSTS
jgi:transposase